MTRAHPYSVTAEYNQHPGRTAKDEPETPAVHLQFPLMNLWP